MRPTLTHFRILAGCMATISMACLLSGCLGLSPVEDPARYYVLSSVNPAPAAGAGSDISSNALAIGIGPVRIAPYLSPNQLAVRVSDEEIFYSDRHLWAEPLEKAVQRVLTHNLAANLNPKSIFVDSWRREDVAYEIYVAVERFDVDNSGRVRLETRWRIQLPGAGPLVSSGFSQWQSQSPPLQESPSNVVQSMNDLLGEFSAHLAEKLLALQREDKQGA